MTAGPEYARGYHDGYAIGHRIGRAQVVRRIEALCAEWDARSPRGESPTTKAIRAAVAEQPPCESP